MKELPAFEATTYKRRFEMQLLMKCLRAVIVKMDGTITALGCVYVQIFLRRPSLMQLQVSQKSHFT